MTPTIHSIPAPVSSPAVRIGGGGSAPTTHAPAVTSFARAGASVAPTVSGCIAAGYPHDPVVRVHKLAGGCGSRHFSRGQA